MEFPLPLQDLQFNAKFEHFKCVLSRICPKCKKTERSTWNAAFRFIGALNKTISCPSTFTVSLPVRIINKFSSSCRVIDIHESIIHTIIEGPTWTWTYLLLPLLWWVKWSRRVPEKSVVGVSHLHPFSFTTGPVVEGRLWVSTPTDKLIPTIGGMDRLWFCTTP